MPVKEDETEIVSTRVDEDTNISGSRPTLVKKKAAIVARSEPETGAQVEPGEEGNSDKREENDRKAQPNTTSQDQNSKTSKKPSKACIIV